MAGPLRECTPPAPCITLALQACVAVAAANVALPHVVLAVLRPRLQTSSADLGGWRFFTVHGIWLNIQMSCCQGMAMPCRACKARPASAFEFEACETSLRALTLFV